ncbi:MAG: nucleotidyl transferase AbiEii/AbiGii toxin family protein [Planctomycetota bacterium]
MTKKEFLKAVSNSEEDVLQLLLDALARTGVDYCVIGGLAVNAYAEPVVSLDLDIVVAADDVDAVCDALAAHFTIECFSHSINLSTNKSDLRIQLQTDPRYQPFIRRARPQTVLGYDMKVAAIEDVLQGKVWAYSDEERRTSKRQKDLADIARLVEAHPSLADRLPGAIRSKLR